MTNYFSTFFTFIGKSAQVRLAGYTALTVIFFGWISFKFWQQHLIDDKLIKDDSKRKDSVIIKLEIEKKVITTDYINYIKQNTRRNDSVDIDNKKFLKQLQLNMKK